MQRRLTPITVSVLPETEDETRMLAAHEGQTLTSFIRNMLEELTETGGHANDKQVQQD
jgi:hypothetical protein